MVVFRSCSWDFTNQMVVDLFFRMGVNILSNVQKQFFLNDHFRYHFLEVPTIYKAYARAM